MPKKLSFDSYFFEKVKKMNCLKNENDPKSEVLLRLSEFRESTGLSMNAFVDKIGMEYVTVLNQFNGKRGLSLDTVASTLSAFSDLSAEWLLRDRGDMLISKYDDSPESIKLKYSERIESLLDTIKVLQDTINMKNATIDALQNEIAQQKSKEA
ncbi:MAG: hypothetical protein J6I86_10555 [Bacteroidaceae bacterium]|nr:hypothetical protein [Bacteroidaceae bacterium]